MICKFHNFDSFEIFFLAVLESSFECLLLVYGKAPTKLKSRLYIKITWPKFAGNLNFVKYSGLKLHKLHFIPLFIDHFLVYLFENAL